METNAAQPSRAGGALVGRQAESAQIMSAIDHAVAGRGAIVLLEGEAGIGKTTLVSTTAQYAEAAGMRIVRAGARELERQVSFSLIRLCLPAEAAASDPALSRIDGLLRGVGGPTLDYRGTVTEEVAALVERWCGDGPVAVLLDDVHWADPASVTALWRIGEMATQLPLFIMAAARPLPREPELTRWWRVAAEDGAILTVQSLPDADVAVLVTHLAGAPAGPGLWSRITGAGGNPLYVSELIAGMQDIGAIEIVDGVAEWREVDGGRWLPRSLTDAVLRRLDTLPDWARSMLSIAASIGCPVDLVELSAVTGASLTTIDDMAVAAAEAGLLVHDESGLVFRHDIIRQVVADQVPASSRAALRRTAARALMTTDATIERIAHCLDADDDALGRRELDWLVRSADALALRAPEQALVLLDRTLATVGLDEHVAERLRVHKVRALLRGGRPADAEAAARTLLAAGVPQDEQAIGTRNMAHWVLARTCFAQGNIPETVTAVRIALAQPGLTANATAHYHGLLTLALLYHGHPDEAAAAAELALSTAENCGDTVAIGAGCHALGVVRYAQGEFDSAAELGQRAMQIYESDIPGAQSDHFDPSVLLSNALIELDRLADAEEVLRVTPRVGRPGIHLAPAHLFARARLCFLSGRWDDALAEIRADDDLPDGYGYRRPMRSLAGIIALRRGRPTPDPDALIDPDDQPGSRAYRHFEWWARALACESQGRPQEALEVLVDAHRRFGSGVTSPTMYYLYPDLARLAHLLDAGQAAEEVAAAAEETAEHRPSHSRRATAALCRGLAESRPELLEVAARSFRLAHRPLFEAQAHESLATLLAQAGRTGAADALGRALELYGGIEANWDSARAEARLRAAGVRRGKRGPRGRPKSGWAALTPTELKVAELVVQGLSNLDIAGQLFLSRRTVATHISSILGKLGLQSRVQLAVSYAKQH